MSRHTDRVARALERDAIPHKVWSLADYNAGHDQGAADMIAAFEQALTAVGISFLLHPHLELRDERPVMLFRIILQVPLPAIANPPILPPVA